MESTEISLTTICGGAVPEVFEREFRELLRNIHDPNTVAEKVRTLTIKFTVKPTEDRSQAAVDFTCKPSLQPVKVVKGQFFLSRHSGQLKAYSVDMRQGALFTNESEAKQPMRVVE